MTTEELTRATAPHPPIDNPVAAKRAAGRPSRRSWRDPSGTWLGLFVIVCVGAALALWWQTNLIAATPAPVMTVPPIPGTVTVAAPAFPEPRKDGRYMVFAGSFVNVRNAERISRQLGEVGINAHLQPGQMAGRNLTHVLVGPFAEEVEANETVSWIRDRTGIPANFLDIRPIPPGDGQSTAARQEKEAPASGEAAKPTQTAAAAKAPVLQAGEYVVLAGSFTNADNANRVQKRLIEEKIPAMLKTSHVQERLFTHVMVGPYAEKEQAGEMVNQIRKETGIVAEMMFIH